MRILIEASGSLTSGYLLSAIQAAGHEAVASDISDQVAARSTADDFIVFPRYSVAGYWEQVRELLERQRIDVVIPSLDETLMGWAERATALRAELQIEVIVSGPAVLAWCQDKWHTYEFFQQHNVPCPATSLAQRYPLVKPRHGRGGQGVEVPERPVDMTGMISQELIAGCEYTVDVLCDRSGEPVYIIPRKRLAVRDGKSVAGVVDMRADIIAAVRDICAVAAFRGPVNLQCFVQDDDSLVFIEVNPRIAGGMALGFAASENWIPLLIDNFVNGVSLRPGPVQDGMKMYRSYAEVFVP